MKLACYLFGHLGMNKSFIVFENLINYSHISSSQNVLMCRGRLKGLSCDINWCRERERNEGKLAVCSVK